MSLDLSLKEIGKRIKLVRENIPMNQTDFSEAIIGEKGQGQVTRWENGQRLPSTERIIRIAKLGNVTVPWLLFGEDRENLQNHFLPLITRMAAIISENVRYKVNKGIDSKEFPDKFAMDLDEKIALEMIRLYEEWEEKLQISKKNTSEKIDL